jgi:hypothetical protein
MAILSEAVIKVRITDDITNNVQIEFNGGNAPIDGIIAGLEIVIEKLRESLKEAQDRSNIN